jgi:phosphoribosylamine--glycine ligase
MITETGPKVIEYNCRFGDPETEVILPVLKTDLVDLMMGSAKGDLGGMTAEQHPLSAVCVIIASGGYPGEYETGKQIVGLDAARMLDERVMVFHAGTAKERNALVSAGGRVLGVTAVGPVTDLEQTIDRAYRAVEKITFDGAYYRSDIGKKGVERLRQLRKEGDA